MIFKHLVRWAARLSAVAIAAIFLAFVLGEPFIPMRHLQLREWAGFIFLFGAIAAMLLAWKWEFPAALISLFALGAFAAVVHARRVDVLIIAAVPNILYLLDWKLQHPRSRLASKTA